MFIKTVTHEDSKSISSAKHPGIAQILNDLNEMFDSRGSSLSVEVTDDSEFKVRLSGVVLPDCQVVEFTPYIPEDRSWTQEEFEEKKLKYRERPGYEYLIFRERLRGWQSVLEGVFVIVQEKTLSGAMRISSAKELVAALITLLEEKRRVVIKSEDEWGRTLQELRAKYGV